MDSKKDCGPRGRWWLSHCCFHFLQPIHVSRLENVIHHDNSQCVHQDRRWDSQIILVFDGKPSDAVKVRAYLDIFVHESCIKNKQAGVWWHFLSVKLKKNVNKYWKYDICIWARGCSHSVMIWPRGCRILPQYDTTRHVLSGTLCTLKRIYKKPHGSSLDLRSVRKNYRSSLLSKSR